MIPIIVRHYFDAFARRDIESLSTLFAENISLQDPNCGLVVGRERVLAVYSNIFATCPPWEVSLYRTYQSGSGSIAVEFCITLSPDSKIAGVDLIDFDESSIRRIRAYLDQSSKPVPVITVSRSRRTR